MNRRYRVDCGLVFPIEIRRENGWVRTIFFHLLWPLTTFYISGKFYVSFNTSFVWCKCEEENVKFFRGFQRITHRRKITENYESSNVRYWILYWKNYQWMFISHIGWSKKSKLLRKIGETWLAMRFPNFQFMPNWLLLSAIMSHIKWRLERRSI